MLFKARMSRRILVAPALLLLATAAPAVGLYKWVDESGTVVYSERPPSGRPAQPVQLFGIHPPPAESPGQVEALNERAEQQRKEREVREQDAADEKSRAARIEQNCESARQNLRVLQTASRIREQGQDEEARFLDEDERAARIATAQKQIEDFCK